jgi:hypothetical protein
MIQKAKISNVIIITWIITSHALVMNAYEQREGGGKAQERDQTLNSKPLKSEVINTLEKIGIIGETFGPKANDHFENVTSISLDSKGNIYVADSEMHKIFKFNQDGHYITSFGKTGQGPGEFSGILRITVGNDEKIYITDEGNWRIKIYSLDGLFIKEYPISRFLYDTPKVNSKGRVFLLSPSGVNLIDCFDHNMKLQFSFLDYSYHYEFPLRIPSNIVSSLYWPIEANVLKAINRQDELVVVSNCSLNVIVFHKDTTIKNIFKVNHKQYYDDYKKRAEKITSKTAWISSFGSVFLDRAGNICLCYANMTLKRPEIYRYSLNGEYLDTLRFETPIDLTNKAILASDKQGVFYSIDSINNNLVLYKEKRNSRPYKMGQK